MSGFQKSIRTFGLFFAFSTLLTAVAIADDFAAANEAYKNSDYEKSVELYEALIPREQSAAVLYNLGNALYELKEYPKAILQFEKALAITPSNPEIRANLKLAQEALQLQPQELSWTETVAVKLNVNTWAWISVVSFWGALALLILPSLWGWRGPLKSGLIVLLVILFSVSTIGLIGYHGLAKLGIAITEEAALKISPTTTSPTKEYLKPGEAASIEREHGDFFFIKTAQNKEGWVNSEYFKPIWD